MKVDLSMQPEIFNYLKCGEYPEGFDKADKRALQKRAALFCVKVTKLYYCTGMLGDDELPYTGIQQPCLASYAIAALRR